MSKGKKTEIEIIQQKPLKNFDKIALNQIQGTRSNDTQSNGSRLSHNSSKYS